MGHSDHWECVMPRLEDALSQLLPLATTEGEAIKGEKLTLNWLLDDQGNRVYGAFIETPIGLLAEAGPLGILALAVPTADARGLALWSGYPFLSRGMPVDMEVMRVWPWENGIEAEVIAQTADGMLISFFDLFYFRDAKKYAIGGAVKVELGAIAFSLQRASTPPIIVDDPDLVRAMRMEFEPQDALDPVEIPTKGMAGLFPVEGWEPSEYGFHGPLKSLQTIHSGGREYYRAVVTVLRGQEDFDLPILAASHVMAGEIPEIGDDVSGHLWLHGRLLGEE